ncbi:hypothetical protein [Jatrophihabitans sp.]|uniref:hypothetical protein n=1 Tax=Jatrophihabitans sp. TaxID=1932789 RepID=UPI0030C70A2F|nr:hypothetical protein [Jatrophihabitans sp.]
MSQFSLFGAAAAEPCLDDLDGVLLAGGWWVHVDGVARLSVVVTQRWRAEALAAEFALRGVGAAEGDAIVPAEAGFGVRTGFHAALNPQAARWSRGANAGPPVDFTLTAGGLRLWAITAGSRDDVGYLLGTALPDDSVHMAGGAQLSRLGLAAVSLSGRGGPGWRVTSAKRIRRLGELLGVAPEGGEQVWT